MIKKIVVVGGGFAGWYTVAALQLHCSDLDIVLIESANIPRLRVGESLGFDSMYAWKKFLGLDDDRALMRRTGAIYKFGVHNINFYNDKESVGHGKIFNLKTNALTSFYNQYEYPDYYEHWSKRPGDLGLLDAWIFLNKDNKTKCSQDFFDEVSDSSYFCSSTSVPFNYRNELTIRNNDGYSYHSDAEEMVGFIKSLVLQRNSSDKVKNIIATVSDVELTEHGNISKLVLDDGQIINGDLYIDCSGFGRVLAKKTHSKHWRAFPGYNNSAWVCPTKYIDPEKEMVCATQISGEDYGWRFLVSLYHRQGNGYVFNDQLADESKVLARLNEVTNGRQIVAPRLIKWNPGLYEKSWVANCITLGVSGGFFDPWDAPTFTEHSRDLEEFINLLGTNTQDKDQTDTLRDLYNQRRNQSIDERRLRVTLAHGLSNRSGPYWDDARQRATKENIIAEFEQILLDTNYKLNQRLPFYWQQFYIKVLALTNTDTSKWKFPTYNSRDLEMAKAFFSFNRARNKYIKSQNWPNSYQWLKEHRFNGATSQEIYEEYNRKG